MRSDFLHRHADALRAASVCACALMILLAALAAFRPELFSAGAVVEASSTAIKAEQTPEPEADPMAEFELEREQLRSMQTAQLNEIIHGENTDEETKRLARQRLLDLGEWMEQEKTIEGVLRMRGYKDAICTVHKDSVNVVLRAESVGRQESAVIYELVLRETGVTGGNVKIIPVG